MSGTTDNPTPPIIPDEHKIGQTSGEGESRINLIYGYLWGKIKDD